jgi:hypothetical protein
MISKAQEWQKNAVQEMYGKVGQLGSNFKNSTLVHPYLLLLQHSLLQEVCKERTTILL